MNNPLPADLLEERASEQRRRLHNSVSELRSNVRERLDHRKLVREHIWQASGVLALVGLVLGWGFTGMFTRR
jgi:ElaB/YqjD/DUF883 family membrane-anchored ribosome-binding protein